MMMKIPWALLPAVLATFRVLTAGCIGQNAELPAGEAAEVLAYAEPIADNLLLGFNENNYTQYSQDFSPQIREGLTEARFAGTRENVVSRIGLYVSRGSPVVTQSGDYIAVNYKADFEREQGVDVRVVFRKGDPSHQIHGLWFNSPKLRS